MRGQLQTSHSRSVDQTYRCTNSQGFASATGRVSNAKIYCARTAQNKSPGPDLKDVPIAPILPGQIGVIGSAGAQYTTTEQTFTTTIGRRDVGQSNTPDNQHVPNQTRRIELRPDINPFKSQLLVASNGGDPKDETQPGIAGSPGPQDFPTREIGRDNELIYNPNKAAPDDIQNITDVDKNGLPDNDANNDGIPDNGYYRSCVAIPVEGMSVSEPPWGYAPREKEAADEEAAIKKAKSPGAPSASTTFYYQESFPDKYDGRDYTLPVGGNKTSYDKPLDTSHELTRTGSTANYRTVHLQRLANPMLPWNPEPTLADGKTPNPEYRPNLPINPYRTIDSASVNLTAFNGTSGREADYPNPSKQMDDGKMPPLGSRYDGSRPV